MHENRKRKRPNPRTKPTTTTTTTTTTMDNAESHTFFLFYFVFFYCVSVISSHGKPPNRFYRGVFDIVFLWFWFCFFGRVPVAAPTKLFAQGVFSKRRAEVDWWSGENFQSGFPHLLIHSSLS